MALQGKRTCGICNKRMSERKVNAPLPLLPVVFECEVCDRAPQKRAAK